MANLQFQGASEPLALPGHTEQASVIAFRTSSTPKNGCSPAEVIIVGKHVGAASKMSLFILGMRELILLIGMVSAFVMMACSVNFNPADDWHCSSRALSIMASVSLMP